MGSSNNIWPWSYDTCDRNIQQEQRISACNRVNHFDMKPLSGRGAPEVDILEAMAGKEKLINTPIHRPYFSSSLQVAPGIKDYRPQSAMPPQEPGKWYDHDIEYGGNDTDLNIFFYGMHLAGEIPAESYLADAISANTNLYETHFEDFHKYRLEWVTGKDGYLKW